MKTLLRLMPGMLLITVLLWNIGCNDTYPVIDREEKIPADIVKRGPETDLSPPILYSEEYELPVPVDYPINTAGAEDSPFILPDGNTLYFFFTPDMRVPPEQQLLDEVTGVWVAYRENGVWGQPERVWLQKPGKLALDGAVCVQDNEMWFASAREGYEGVNMFTALWKDGQWRDWAYAGDRLMQEIGIGEVHIHGNDLYFHADRSGGKGNLDIWVTQRTDDTWSDPVNIDAVNTTDSEGFPFLSSDGREMWFTRTYQGTPAVYRSFWQNDNWSAPELIVSQFAGEPTLDDAGNLYFVHHYYENNVGIEADIYVADRK